MPQTEIGKWKEYAALHREAQVTIAGKTYGLVYRIQEAVEIERRTDKSVIGAMLSGVYKDSSTVLWAGLKHHKQLGSPDAVVALLQEHLRSDDAASCAPIFKAAYRCAVASKLLGGPDEVNIDEFERLLGDEGKASETEAPNS